LRIRLPRSARRLHRVSEIARVDDAARAVTADALRAAGDHRDVVREAGVRQRAVVGKADVLSCERCERRRGWAADHLLLVLVLEDDHDHVIETRHRRGAGCSRDEQQREETRHISSSTTRRRTTWRTAMPITTRTPAAIAA